MVLAAVILAVAAGQASPASAAERVFATRDSRWLQSAVNKRGAPVILVFRVPDAADSLWALRPNGQCIDFSTDQPWNGESGLIFHGEEILRRVIGAVHDKRAARPAAEKLLAGKRLLALIDLNPLGGWSLSQRMVVRVVEGVQGPTCEHVRDPDALTVLNGDSPPDDKMVRVPAGAIGVVRPTDSFFLRMPQDDVLRTPQADKPDRIRAGDIRCPADRGTKERPYYKCPLRELVRAETVLYKRDDVVYDRRLNSATETLGLLDGLLPSGWTLATLGEFKIKFNYAKPSKGSRETAISEIVGIIGLDGREILTNGSAARDTEAILAQLGEEAVSLVRNNQGVTIVITGFADALGATPEERDKCNWERQLYISVDRVLWAEWLIRNWMKKAEAVGVSPSAWEIERVARGCSRDTQQRMVTIQLKPR